MKKEQSIEEAAEEYYNDCILSSREQSILSQAFIKGAKYQASISYTEEEVRDLLFEYAQFIIDSMDGKKESKPVGVWFEQNKKQLTK